ncbi:MAG: S9 family peptidase [Pseudomonadota bacterium]|nr:S9 family peptidase [Pseudomonadota bacterium]
MSLTSRIEARPALQFGKNVRERLLTGLCALCLSGVTAVPAVAQPAPSEAPERAPFTIEDLFDVSSVGTVSVAPDAAHTVYTRWRRPNIIRSEQDGGAASETRVWMRDGTNRLVLDERVGAYSFDWMSDSQLTFRSGRLEDGGSTIFGIDVSAPQSEPFPLFNSDSAIDMYDTSPGASALFYSTTAPETEGQDGAETGFLVNVTDRPVPPSHVVRVDFERPDVTESVLPIEGYISDLVASPDGQRLAVSLAPSPSSDDYMLNSLTIIFDGETGARIATVPTTGKIGDIAFSPDGRYLALMASPARSDSAPHAIAVFDVQAETLRFLTDGDDADEVDFFWSADDELTVLQHRSTQSGLFNMTVEGNRSGEISHSGFVVHRFDGNRHGIAGVISAPHHAHELATGRDMSRRTDGNPWLSDRQLGNQDVVRYRARDGVEIEGILVTPDGERPETGWPLIVLVHGGPESHYFNAWATDFDRPVQFGAGRGYAVFLPNYRGSTGRGEAFAALDRADAPAAEFNDILDGVDFLANSGLIDPSRVGITGQSHGGYAAAWGATAQTGHFAAAVAAAPVTDLVSSHGTTDIPEETVVNHYGVAPEEDWELYLNQSPVFHAAQSRTPTLILHGESDSRVNVGQSLELYGYLRRVGQSPVRLVTYPEQGHRLSRSAVRYDYALRMMRWFDTFVMPGDRNAQLPSPDLEEIQNLVAGRD